MASQLIQRISLEGGQEFKAALEAIGASGKAAFAALSSGVSSAGQVAASAGQKFQEIGSHLQTVKTNAEEAGSALQSSSRSLLTTGLEIAAVFAGISAAIELIRSKTKEAAKEIGDEGDAAKKLGLSLQQLQVLKDLGAESKDLTSAFEAIQKKMDEAANGSAKASAEFARMGVNIYASAGKLRDARDVAQDLAKRIEATGGVFNAAGIQIRSVADGLSQVSGIAAKVVPAVNALASATQKNAAAQEIGGQGFAKSFDALAKLGPKFKETAEDLKDFAAATQKDADLSKKVTDSFDDLSKISKNLWNQVYLSFADYVIESNKALTEFLKDNKDTILAIAKFAGDTFKQVADALSGAFKGAAGLIPKDAIISVVSAIGSAIKNLALDTKTLFTQGFNALPAESSLRSIVPFVLAVSQAIGTLAGQVYTLFTKGIDALPMESALRMFLTLAQTVGAAFIALGNAVYEAISKEDVISSASELGKALATIGGYVRQAIGLFQEFKGGVTGVWQVIISGASLVTTALKALTGIEISPVGLLFALMFFNFVGVLGAVEVAMLALSATVSIVTNGFSAFVALAGLIGAPWLAAIAGIAAALYGLYSNWSTIKQGFIDGITAITDWMQSKFEAVINWVSAKLSALSSALGLSGSSSSSSAQGYASGGYVSGPGTSTSDSVPARLSVGEFVHTARAVGHYGVGMMHAINNLRFPVAEAVHMATGGFVGSAPILPNLSGGVGSAGPRTSVTLQIGGETFVDMLTPTHVAEKLVRFATNKQARSMGVKPSWA